MSSLTQSENKVVLGDMNLNMEQFNSPKKNATLLSHLESLVNAENETNKDNAQDMQKESALSKENQQNHSQFSFKLNPVSQKVSNFQEDEACISQSKKSLNESSPMTIFDKSIAELDQFILKQRVLLSQKISSAQTAQEQNEILNEFFNQLYAKRLMIPNQAALSKSKCEKSPKKKSPLKSPNKKSRQNDENVSPSKHAENSFVSPVKKSKVSPLKNSLPLPNDQNSLKENRLSQRRRQKLGQDDNLNNIYLQENNQNSTEKCQDQEQGIESKTPLPKSPVKRMRNLEDQENLENQENIETTFRKSPTKVLKGGETDASPIYDEVPDKEGDVEPTNEFQVKEIKLSLGPSNQSMSLLDSKLNNQNAIKTQVQQEKTVVPIQEILDVDSNVINYGQFICGKILGSTLLLSNISEQDQIITMSISKEKIFNCDTTFGQYNRDELPFAYQDGTIIKNSEIEFNCWFIENPVSKELQKTITLKIGPQMSQEFIIVVKAPKNRLQSRIVSFIDIKMTQDALSKNSQTEKHLNHKSEGIVEKQAKIERKMDVLLLGYLDNPKIKCMKQLYNKQANSELVSLAVKKTQGIQRFKLPFKNLSTYLDSDIEFAFIRTQSGANSKEIKPLTEYTDPIDCLSFYCQPNQLKIAAEQISILTVQVKVNTDLLTNEEKVDQKQLKQPLNKLLVARLKNSQVLFSFFVSITLVD